MAKRKSESASGRIGEMLDPEVEAEPGLKPGPRPEPELEPEAEAGSAPAPTAEEDDKPYTVGAWNGKPQWKCGLCPWDTLEGEAAILEHIATRHKPPAPRVSVLVADKHGRPIN